MLLEETSLLSQIDIESRSHASNFSSATVSTCVEAVDHTSCEGNRRAARDDRKTRFLTGRPLDIMLLC